MADLLLTNFIAASNKITVHSIPQAGKVETMFHSNQSVDCY